MSLSPEKPERKLSLGLIGPLTSIELSPAGERNVGFATNRRVYYIVLSMQYSESCNMVIKGQ